MLTDMAPRLAPAGCVPLPVDAQPGCGVAQQQHSFVHSGTPMAAPTSPGLEGSAAPAASIMQCPHPHVAQHHVLQADVCSAADLAPFGYGTALHSAGASGDNLEGEEQASGAGLGGSHTTSTKSGLKEYSATLVDCGATLSSGQWISKGRHPAPTDDQLVTSGRALLTAPTQGTAAGMGACEACPALEVAAVNRQDGTGHAAVAAPVQGEQTDYTALQPPTAPPTCSAAVHMAQKAMSSVEWSVKGQRPRPAMPKCMQRFLKQAQPAAAHVTCLGAAPAKQAAAGHEGDSGSPAAAARHPRLPQLEAGLQDSLVGPPAQYASAAAVALMDAAFGAPDRALGDDGTAEGAMVVAMDAPAATAAAAEGQRGLLPLTVVASSSRPATTAAMVSSSSSRWRFTSPSEQPARGSLFLELHSAPAAPVDVAAAPSGAIVPASASAGSKPRPLGSTALGPVDGPTQLYCQRIGATQRYACTGVVAAAVLGSTAVVHAAPQNTSAVAQRRSRAERSEIARCWRKAGLRC